MQTIKKKVIDAVVITGSATTYSDVFDMQNFTGACATFILAGTGTLTGTVKLQMSNGDGSWIDIPSATATLSTTTPLQITVSLVFAALIRAAVVSTANTSTVSCTIMAKEG